MEKNSVFLSLQKDKISTKGWGRVEKVELGESDKSLNGWDKA